MITLAKFPVEVRVTDDDIRTMSISDIQNSFTIAKALLGQDEFTEYCAIFWIMVNRVRSNPSNASIQKIVDDLESVKRQLGRQYNSTKSISAAIKYNEIEYDIRQLVANYNVKRTSKPYLLGSTAYSRGRL